MLAVNDVVVYQPAKYSVVGTVVRVISNDRCLIKTDYGKSLAVETLYLTKVKNLI